MSTVAPPNPPESGSPDAPAPAAKPRRVALGKSLRFLAAPLIVAAVPALALYAQTQIKDTIESFFGDCLFVVEKRLSKEGHILVTGYLSGTPPKALPMVFAGNDAALNMVIVEDAYRQEEADEPMDLAFHPMTYGKCPGQLCGIGEDVTESHMLPITLTDLHNDFTYRFRVRAKPYDAQAKVTTAHLRVHAVFDQGLDNGTCRVQPKNWRNFWVWAGPVQKFLLFAAIVIAAAALLRFGKQGAS
jgi:hypothetical protein